MYCNNNVHNNYNDVHFLTIAWHRELSLPTKILSCTNLRVLVVDHMEECVRPSVMAYCVLPRSCIPHSLTSVTPEQPPTCTSSRKNVVFSALLDTPMWSSTWLPTTIPTHRLPVLLMELCDQSLTTFLERSPGPLSYHIQINICHDIALALVYLHSNGLIHRDLTGNNVLMIAGTRAKITDFGDVQACHCQPSHDSLDPVSR